MLPNRENLIDKKFNKLLVIKYSHTTKKKAYWICRCDCGKLTMSQAAHLKRNGRVSCGCSAIIDYSFRQVGKVVPIIPLYSFNGSFNWLCLCECGKTKVVSSKQLKIASNSFSCGNCLSIEEKKLRRDAQLLYRNRVRGTRMKNVQGSFTQEEFDSLCSRYINLCLCCLSNKKKLTVDHIIPISKNGSNNISNIQPLCKNCNCSKLDKTIDYRWLPEEESK